LQYAWYVRLSTEKKLMWCEPRTGVWSRVEYKTGIRDPLIPVGLILKNRTTKLFCKNSVFSPAMYWSVGGTGWF